MSNTVDTSNVKSEPNPDTGKSIVNFICESYQEQEGVFKSFKSKTKELTIITQPKILYYIFYYYYYLLFIA